jgi:hypothetical protein
MMGKTATGPSPRAQNPAMIRENMTCPTMASPSTATSDISASPSALDWSAQPGFRWRRKGGFNNRADGRIISRFFGTNDYAGMLSNPETPIEQEGRALYHSPEICAHENSTTSINVAPAL